ncbi:MAG: hypothetical protein ACM3SX_05510 [Deltaproteobacteria bacterium]
MMMSLSADEQVALIRAAVAAPSADNHHAIRFEVSAAALRLHVDRSIADGAPVHRKLFHELAFGAMIENIVLSAERIGRHANVVQYPPWSGGVVADIQFTAAVPGCPVDACGDAIFARTTNRRLYERSRRVPGSILDELAHAAASRGDARVDWLDDDPRRSRILRLIFAAERERFANERLHRELFEAIRFDVGWLATSETGLPPGSLEIEAPFRPIFKALRRWSLQRAMNAIGGSRLMAVRAAWFPAWTAPHIALLTVPRGSDVVDAGRALQRLWLCATLHSIAFQPLAAAIALTSQSVVDGWVTEEVIERMRGELNDLAGDRRAVMIARLGYAPAPTVRAGRGSEHSYVLDAVGTTGPR